jgi:ATP-dependent Clp protease ATP-binding subunit ClpB
LAAVNLSVRYITNRFLPDKAVDLIDEAASMLKISLENKPQVLDEVHRKITRLEIETEALMRESKEDPKKQLMQKIVSRKSDKEIADIRETDERSWKSRWNTEKDILADTRKIKKELKHCE